MDTISMIDGSYFLYAVTDLTDGKIYFNANGSAYKNANNAYDKIKRLKKKLPDHVF